MTADHMANMRALVPVHDYTGTSPQRIAEMRVPNRLLHLRLGAGASLEGITDIGVLRLATAYRPRLARLADVYRAIVPAYNVPRHWIEGGPTNAA